MAKITAEDRKLVARMKEIRDLIAEFGLVLYGHDPGITATIKDKPGLRGDGWAGEPIAFDGVEWGWLEPLLVELRRRRKVSDEVSTEGYKEEPEMNVGRELDEMVHQIVFGRKLLTVDEMRAEAERVWKDQPSCCNFLMGFMAFRNEDGSVRFVNTVNSYSTKIGAAWDVVDRIMGSELQDFTLEATEPDRWTAKSLTFVATAETPALAICLVGVQAFKVLKGAL